MENETKEEAPAPAEYGGPPRPLLEATLFFCAFWLRAFVPMAPLPAGAGLASPGWHLGILVSLLPSTALLLYFIARGEGLAAFGIRTRPRARDLPWALVLTALALLLGYLPELLRGLFPAGSASPLDNPLLAAVGKPDTPPLLFVPLVLLSCLATGYAEELFFRVYLLKRLGQAGVGWAAAIIGSSLLFGLAHGSQGPVGALIAGLLGALFALRWRLARSWHEIALGHGLYDFVVLVALFYA
jgi:membrane protease YdiL (CAAX protease family)